MKIRDLFQEPGPLFSFEFFPPKDDEGAQALYGAIRDLEPLAPSFVSVTYGAGGSTRRRTVDLVKTIRSDTGIEPMAHLTCVGASREELGSVLDELREGGIENLLALRGDPPKGEDSFHATEGGFRHANELVEFLRTRYDFCVGAACYPEKHPECPSLEEDLRHLKRKSDAGADFLISQLFFDNEDFLRFRDRAVMAGIETPIIAGIMPILSGPQIKRIVSMCGARIPEGLLKHLEAAGDDAAEVRKVGVEHAWRQCRGLLDEGVAGIHFYTLNRSTATKAIWRKLVGD